MPGMTGVFKIPTALMIFLLELTTDEVFFSIKMSEGDLDKGPAE